MSGTLLDRGIDEIRAAIAEARASGDLRALREIEQGLTAALAWKPQAHQVAPDRKVAPWWMWLFSGGRGTGKSDGGAHWLNEHMTGPPCDPRVPGGHKALVCGPTYGETVASCWGAPSGLSVHNPRLEKIGKEIRWPNGAVATITGGYTERDAEQLRAFGNVCTWWFDEAAIIRHLRVALDNVAFGGRLGPDPHGIATSTPKPYPAWRYLTQLPGVVQTVASTYDNRFLPAVYRRVVARYEGTRLGRQELYGELMDDFEGALWHREPLDAHRIRTWEGAAVSEEQALERLTALSIVRTMEGVDPSTWDPDIGDDPGTVGEGVETGIVVVGIDDRSPAPHVYVLDDLSIREAGDVWARRAANGAHRWHATVVPETNAGGGLVLATIRLVDPEVPIYRKGNRVGVRARIGKRARAEEVAHVYDQGRAHHVGEFPELENQMCQWDPRESWSPDRLDALVWGVHALEPWHFATAEFESAAGQQI